MKPDGLTNEEWRAVQHLRALKADDGGRGHGTLRVEVVNGRESLFKREHSEKVAR